MEDEKSWDMNNYYVRLAWLREFLYILRKN
jgi:hypothetical protein